MVVGLYFQTSVSTIKCLKSLLCPLASKLLLSLVILSKAGKDPEAEFKLLTPVLLLFPPLLSHLPSQFPSPAGSLLFLLARIRHTTSSFSLATSIFFQNICLANWCHIHTFARIHSTQMAASSPSTYKPPNSLCAVPSSCGCSSTAVCPSFLFLCWYTWEAKLLRGQGESADSAKCWSRGKVSLKAGCQGRLSSWLSWIKFSASCLFL